MSSLAAVRQWLTNNPQWLANNPQWLANNRQRPTNIRQRLINTWSSCHELAIAAVNGSLTQVSELLTLPRPLIFPMHPFHFHS